MNSRQPTIWRMKPSMLLIGNERDRTLASTASTNSRAVISLTFRAADRRDQAFSRVSSA
jgi:hypothetical protein